MVLTNHHFTKNWVLLYFQIVLGVLWLSIDFNVQAENPLALSQNAKDILVSNSILRTRRGSLRVQLYAQLYLPHPPIGTAWIEKTIGAKQGLKGEPSIYIIKTFLMWLKYDRSE